MSEESPQKPGLATRLGAGLRDAHRRDPLRFRVRAALALVLVLLLARLAFGPDPFSDGIAGRLAEGKSLEPRYYAETWTFWASLFDAVLVVGLLAASRWFLRDAPLPPAPRPPKPPRAFVGLLALAALLAGALAAPRLDHSLWDDEAYTVRHAVDGGYRMKKSGELTFDRVKLRDTLWFYRMPNNHVPFSLSARASVATWRAVARPETRFVSERAFRLPAWLAGMGAVAAFGWLLLRLGSPAAGLLAAFLLALHPWHMKYLSEGRGYSMAMLWIALYLLATLRVLEHGSWRRWLGYGAAQFMLMWTYPAAVYMLLLANLAVGVALLRRDESPARAAALWRWLVVGVVGGGLWVLLMAPNLAQLPAYLAGGYDMDLGGMFLRNTLSSLWIGMPYALGSTGANYEELRRLLAASPVLLPSAIAATIGLAALGAARVLRTGGDRALVGALLILYLPLTYGITWLRQDVVFPWYFVVGVPALASLVALGATWPLEAARHPGARAAAAAACVALLLGQAWLTQPPRLLLWERALEPERDSVLRARPSLDPDDPANARVLTTSFYRGPDYYDPLGTYVGTPEEMRVLMRESDRTGHPLYVNVGRPSLTVKNPAMHDMVVEGSDFELLETYWGSGPRGARRLYRYVGSTSSALPESGD